MRTHRCSSSCLLLASSVILSAIGGTAAADVVGAVCTGGNAADITDPAVTQIFDTINTAGDPFRAATQAIDPSAANVIYVSGTCSGGASLPFYFGWDLGGYSDLTIEGVSAGTMLVQEAGGCNPPQGARIQPLLNIHSGSNVTVRTVTLGQGGGVSVTGNSTAAFAGVDINGTGNVFAAVLVSSGQLSISRRGQTPSMVRNGCGNGIQVTSGGELSVVSSQIIDNAGYGIWVQNGSASVGFNSLIRNNSQGGIWANQSDVLLFGSPEISSNGLVPNAGHFQGQFHSGINLHQANLSTGGNPLISGNYGHGILADLASVIRLSGVTVTANMAEGLMLRVGSVADLTPRLSDGQLAINVFNGNAITDIDCDTSSILAGDFSAVGQNKCNSAIDDSKNK